MRSSAIQHAPDHETGWRSDGECDRPDVDVELFFDTSRSDEAKQLCAVCDVSRECLEYALDENIKYGVFGGLEPKERRALKRKHRAA